MQALEIPVQTLHSIIDGHCASNPDSADALRLVLQPVTAVMDKYSMGLKGFQTEIILKFLAIYIETETIFSQESSREDAVRRLKAEHSGTNDLYRIMLAHKHHKYTSKIVIGLIDYIRSSGLVSECLDSLRDILRLDKPDYHKVTNTARQVVFEEAMPSFSDRVSAMESFLRLCTVSGADAVPHFDSLLDPSISIVEVLVPFLRHPTLTLTLTLLAPGQSWSGGTFSKSQKPSTRVRSPDRRSQNCSNPNPNINPNPNNGSSTSDALCQTV